MQAFIALIDRLSAAAGDERQGLEEEIWSRFGVDKALLSLDMSRFSLSVRRSGILPYLALIRRMQLLTAPLVERHHGQVVKYVADNLLAVFDNAADAARCAVQIHEAIAAGDEQFTVAVGIDCGRFILIPGADCFGDTVNVACKLGEDVAEPGEVLLTDAARERLGSAFPYALREQKVSISGLELAVFGVLRPGAA
jgi:class 3 adenylate cyclase